MLDKTSDRAAIEAVVRTYLDGLYEGDTAKLASAFAPTSALTDVRDGRIHVLPREEWLKLVGGRESPKARGLSRHDEIVSIDQADDVTACVKVKCAIPPRFFTDYLCLLKVDGRWQVAQKVFTTEHR